MASCCNWSATDVLSGGPDPGAPVPSALRHEEVVRWSAGPGATGPALRPAGWLAVCVRQPARCANARPVFRPLRILHLGEASRGRPVYRGLDAGACARDGLDGIEAAAGGDRAGEV